jgi:AmiR/NasT family two-component response regulator
MAESLDILIAHGDDERRARLRAILEGMEHRIIASVSRGKDLIADVLHHHPDLIVSSVRLEDMKGVDALIEACRHDPRPSVIVAAEEDMDEVEKALEDHVMAYLVEPVDADTLRPTIYLVRRRFEQYQELRREVRELKDSLEARKSIERAKGLLMRQRGLGEDAAYKLLRKTANDRRKAIVDVAEALLLADEMNS